MMIFWVYFNNALNALSALANNIAQCVFRNIFKYHNSNISKTHWTFNVKYRNISITHWDSQCVFEIFEHFPKRIETTLANQPLWNTLQMLQLTKVAMTLTIVSYEYIDSINVLSNFLEFWVFEHFPKRIETELAVSATLKYVTDVTNIFMSKALRLRLIEILNVMRPGPQGAGRIKFFSFIMLRGNFGLFVLISQNWTRFKQIGPDWTM